MQFTLKSLLIFILGAAIGVSCARLGIGLWKSSHPHSAHLVISVGAAALGGGIGALLKCPGRGAVIGFLCFLALVYTNLFFVESS